MFKNFSTYVLLVLIGGLLAACDSTQIDPDNGRESTIEVFNPHLGPVASKQYLYEAFLDYESETFSEGGLQWTATFLRAYPVGDGSVTRFEYTVDRPTGSSGTHFSYRLPVCARESYVDGSASPEPGVNNNANGDLEWGPSDLIDGLNTVTLDFANPAGADSVRWGVVQIGLKTPGSGSDQQLGEIVGPCRGRYTIQGTVFLNDYEGEQPDEIQDEDEPGLANVEVTLEENVNGAWRRDNSSGVRFTNGDQLATFGFYQFEVVIPPSAGDGSIEGAPSGYRVRIAKEDSLGGINTALFNGDIFEVTCLKEGTCVDQGDAITKEVSIVSNPDVAEVNFGFEIDTKKAIDNFDNEFLVSDGLDRSYWSDIASQRSKKNEVPDYDLTEFGSFLNCSSANVVDPSPDGAPDTKCIYDPAGDSTDFGGDVDDLIETVFGLDGISVAEAVNILKNDSNGNPQEALRTQLLTALLNYTTGRGICVGTGLEGGTCSEWDETATRSVIQNALVVLVKSGYSSVQKASSGSVGSNTELLDRMN